MEQILLTHDWAFADGRVGHYEAKFYDIDEAKARFEYLKLLIEVDDYDFIPQFIEANDSFIVCEDKASLTNRQDLKLTRMEVTL